MKQESYIYPNYYIVSIIAIITFINTLLAIQGFCMTDEGWALSGYQQLFKDPQSIEYQFLYYLSMLIGGIWYLLFGEWGIFSFRLLSVLFFSLSIFIIYRIFKSYLTPACFALVAALMTIIYNGVIVFNYTILTSLIIVLITWTLLNWYKNRSMLMLFLAGVLIGMSIFARIPNLSLFALSLIFLFLIPSLGYNYCIKSFGLFVLGILVGILSIITLLYLFGHLDVFVNCLSSGFSAAESSDSTHNLVSIVGVLLRDCLKIFIWVVFFTIFLIFDKYSLQLRSKSVSIVVEILFVLVYVGLFILLLRFTGAMMAVYGFLTVLCVMGVANVKYDQTIRVICVISLIIMYCIPLGSDLGINNMGTYAIWGALPVSVYIFRKTFSFTYKRSKIALILMLTLFVVGKANSCLHQTYGDNGPRWSKVYRINHPLASVYTTKEKKVIVECLLNDISDIVNKGDYVLFFQNLPMMHYLTETKPYLYNSWPWTYDSDNLEKQLKRAFEEKKILPIVIREKTKAGDFDITDENWDNDNAKESFVHKNGRIKAIKSFLTEHNYYVTLENNFYQILKSDD